MQQNFLIEFRESNKPSMKRDQFKNPVSHMCLTGTVVISWSLTQEVAGSSRFNDKHFCH